MSCGSSGKDVPVCRDELFTLLVGDHCILEAEQLIVTVAFSHAAGLRKHLGKKDTRNLLSKL